MPRAELQRLVTDAPPELAQILDPARGAVEPPIRSVIFGAQRFAQHGRSLAATHRAQLRRSRSPFFPRLEDNVEVLREAYRYIGSQAASGHDISPAAEWLLDNFHLIAAQLGAIRDGLPRRYFRALPVLLDEPLAGLPRIYGVGWAFVAHTDGAFDAELLTGFLGAYQEVRELELGELWALPTTLRVLLVETLRRLAERLAAQKAARELANRCCDRIEDYGLPGLDAILGLLNRRGVGRIFLAQMAQRLQGRLGPDGRQPAPGAVHDWLQHVLPDPAAAQAQISADQAADNLSVSNAVSSLRTLGDADWPGLIERCSTLVQLLLGSPVFAAEHASTRDQSLHAIERLARRSARSESAIARTLLGLMPPGTHGGSNASAQGPRFWLLGPGRAALLRALGLREDAATAWRAALRRHALPLYLGTLALATGALLALLLHPFAATARPAGEWLALVALLLALPASEAVIAVVNRLISESARPCRLPRLALADGVPEAQRVLVVVPALLADAASGDALVHRLLLHHLANPERHAQFALLTDWPDARSEQLPDDRPLLDGLCRAIGELNQRHPAPPGGAPRFIVLHRPRRFSRSEQRWIGWERKRGKLEQLVAAIAENDATAFIDLGEASRLAPGIRYVLTLDSDTQLPPGRLRELVGVAAHPHNQPRLDPDTGRIERGYGILQPHVATPLPAPGELTPYHWLFAGQCGIDPYSAASSEVYQDLFDEGTFSGKGLLHVQALYAVLHRRLPEEQVLSHDLLEGALARCAALTDVAVIEDAPFHADVAASRVHRWTRGDWQLLPLLLQPRRWPLAALNRWKMLDNLRRSLVAPAALALLGLALAGIGPSPWVVLALVAAAFTAGPLMGAVAALSPSRDDIAKRHFYRAAGVELLRALGGGAWHLAQLLRQALLSADAIGRALWRTGVSRRRLLQWTTAAAAAAQASTHLGRVWRLHAAEALVAAALLLALFAAGSPHSVLAVVVCLVFANAPLLTWWASTPRGSASLRELDAGERAYLEGVARDSWHLFERCVGPQEHYLPPDNLQVQPHDIVAHRSSPTNIGLYLLATACARAFGWIGNAELLSRLEATLGTLGRLRRHRGHFLNWYDTQTLAPLLPMYVSTVDSGNLCGHLLAVAAACRERAQQAGTDAGELARLLDVAARCEALAWEPEFGFLLDPRRHLFHIGYRVEEQQLDDGFYDLLASEARLTSLLAIAKGEVPARHWAALGRPFFASGTVAGLRSWSGSMFEYLMPSLVLDEPHGSVLREAGRAALREQIAFAEARGVPWGISESAYAASDHTLAYQYAPQGVPRLALRRTPADELVIAPYATALAAQVGPRRAARNFHALERLAPRGGYGFIEALDFSPARRSGDAGFTPVATFMAHHQGMSIVALANVLLAGAPRRWGMAHAAIEAVASLLHERTPREIHEPYDIDADAPPLPAAQQAPGMLRELLPGTQAVEPTQLLSNGRYCVALRANGAGFSRCGPTGITRWRDDALRDAHGSFFYLRRIGAARDGGERLHSITQHPAPDPAADYRAVFHADRVCFETTWPDLQTHATVWVSPEDDIEFRRLELRNLGDAPLQLELVSAFEVTLAEARADESHPAFMNLFVRADWQAEDRALVFARRPRLPHETPLQAAHFLASADVPLQRLCIQVDRARWLGRNGDAAQPQATLEPLPAGDQALDTGLDPVCVLAVQLHIAPQAKAELVFATAASESNATLNAVIDKYRQPTHVQRASLMSATLTGIRLREMGLGPETLAAVQTLSTALLLSLARTEPDAAGLPPRRAREVEAEWPEAAATAPPTEVCDRRLLWRFGISGDRPLIVVFVSSARSLGLLRALAQALRHWAWAGVPCDLVVINTEPLSYLMALQHEAAALRDRHAAEAAALGAPPSTALHLIAAAELSADELSTLYHLARLWLHADGRPLQRHVEAWEALHAAADERRDAIAATALHRTPRRGAPLAAPSGEFAADGEFRFGVDARQRPARPWVNVLANAGFGAQLSEAGGGYSWGRNSRLNPLTPWSNDPVVDPPGEWFLLQDGRTLDAWSVSPSAWRDPVAAYRVAHGQGYSVITHRRGDLEVQATWCVDPEASVKQLHIRLVNHGRRELQLRLVAMAEWILGANRSDRRTIVTALQRQRLPPAAAANGGTPNERRLTALHATQRERAAGFGGGTAFLALASAGREFVDWSCDRREFFDARGSLVLPDDLGQASGSALDPCAALSTRIALEAGATQERVFLLGYADDAQAARQLAMLAAATPASARFEAVRAFWDRLLAATEVRTPDPLFDALVNHWLPYQTLACRIWAKAGFYQAGGATGFRDQLQDATALAWAAPQLLRAQIVTSAARQFVEGDVQHWWHAPSGAGVRTRFSDDLLWLAYACVRYLQATDDASVLDEAVPFLDGPPLADGAEDAYFVPSVSAEQASVYEHAARAIDRSLRSGAHGLPLMGGGDWNDGMNRVGIEGRGESVWLGFFLCRLVEDFAPIARARGDAPRAQRWEDAAKGWRGALAGPAWDGAWFKRAFFDNGLPLGAQANAEARIDLIAQAWAVLSDAVPQPLQRSAMQAAQAQLFDERTRLIKLLDPPLQHAQPSAGYVQAYPPGVRENGGQYSHAGVWALMAQAELARRDGADGDAPYRSFTWLSPAHRAAHADGAAVYAIEPYVMAGDVYAQPPHAGRGGWSWYTGAAGWMHRAALESIFGLELRARELRLQPLLPAHWTRAELVLRRDERVMHFVLVRETLDAAQAEIATASAAEGQTAARLLLPGAWLRWAELPGCSRIVVPLIGTRVAPSATRDTHPEQPAR